MKKRDTSKKRSDILEAARALFLTQGFDNANMDGIAEHANASKRTVYNHFSSKEELFQAVIQESIDELKDQKTVIFCSETPVEAQIAQYLDIKIELTRNVQFLDFMRLTFGVMMTHPSIAQHVRENIHDCEAQLVEWLNAAQAAGKIKVDAPQVTAQMLEKWASGAFLWPSLVGLEDNLEQMQQKKKHIIEWFLWHCSKDK